MKTTMIKALACCLYCNAILQAEEIEHPFKDEHGDTICDDCYTEHYQFKCGLCEEYSEKDPKSGELGSNVFVLFTTIDSYAPGFFQILKWPFMMGPLIGQIQFIPGAIQRIADLPAGTEQDQHYPCAPVCISCQKKYRVASRKTRLRSRKK